MVALCTIRFNVQEDRQRMYEYDVIFIRVRATIFCSGKGVSITCSEFVFIALVIQHALLVRRFVICGLSGCTIFSMLSHKRHDFRGKSD